MGLVPGRECGRCGVCCKVTVIDDKELKKPASVVCLHFIKGAGCRIYKTRPQTCRGYYCGWRMMSNLDDDWRPDRSGVFITDVGGEVSEEDCARGALKLVIGGVHAVVRPTFVEFVCTMVEKGIPIYLSVPGPVGHPAAKVRVNADLEEPVRWKDMERVVDRLLGVLKGLTKFAFDAPPMHFREEM